MKKPSGRVLDRLQQAQADTMGDLCNIYHVSYITGSYSDDETPVLTGTFNIPCGINFNNGSIREASNDSQVLLLDYDVMLRVSAGQVVRMDDQIVLVEKGEFLVSGTFRPSSAPTFNSTVQHVPLKRLVT